MSDKDMKLRLIVEAKNEAGSELERLHQQARRSGSAVAEAYQQAFALIGASTSDVYGQMRLQYGADAAAFAQLTGDKETAYALYAKRLVELDRSAAAAHRSLATAASEAFGSGIRAQADDFARSLVGVSSAAKTTEGVLGPLDKELEELRQATGLSAEEFVSLQARFAQTTAEKAQENSLLSIAKAAVLSRAEIQQLGQAMGLNAGQIDRVTTAAHGAAPAINTLVSLSQTAQNGLGKTADASVAGLAQDLTALSQGGRIAQTSLDGLGTELDELRRHSQLTDAQFATLQAKFQQTSAEKMQEQALRNLAASCNLTEQEIHELGNQFGLSRAQIESVVGSTKKAETSVLSLGTVARGALAYLSVSQLAQFSASALDTGVQVDSLNRAMVAITGSHAAAANEMSFLSSTAEDTGQNMYKLADGYKQLSASTKDTELEGEKTEDIFLAVSEAAAVLGLSQDRVSASIAALSQMASKGTVQMEELKGQLGDHIPGAVQITARAMGVSTEQLMAMAAQGKLLAVDVLPALARELHILYGEAAQTAALESGQAAVNQLSQAWTGFKSNIYESSKDVIIPSIQAIASALNMLSGAGEGLGSVVPKTQRFRAADYLREQIAELEKSKADLLNNDEDGGLSEGQIDGVRKLTAEVEKYRGELERIENIGTVQVKPGGLKKQITSGKELEDGRKKLLSYIQTREQKINQDYEEAVKFAQSSEEIAAAGKTRDEALATLSKKNASSGLKAARGELTQLNAEIRNYTDQARDAAQAADEWLRIANSSGDAIADLIDQYATAGMGEFAAGVYEQGKALAEARKDLDAYSGSLETIDGQIASVTAAYEVSNAKLGELMGKLGGNAAGSDIQDANAVNALQEQTEKLLATLTALTAEKARMQGLQGGAEGLIGQIDESYRVERLQSAYSQIGAYTADIYAVLKEEYEADAAAFEAATGNKVAAQEMLERKMAELDLSNPSTSWARAVEIGLDRVADKADETGTSIASAIEQGFDSASDALADFVVDFEADIDGMVNAILKDLARIAIQSQITSPVAAALSGLLSGGGGSVAMDVSSLIATSGLYHTGGVVGSEGGTRNVPLSTFMSAPRFHTGLQGNEFPAILKNGESVLTEGQMSAIGKGLSGSSQPNVSVVVNNNSSVQATATVSQSGDGMNYDVIVEMVEQKMQDRVNRGRQAVGKRAAYL